VRLACDVGEDLAEWLLPVTLGEAAALLVCTPVVIPDGCDIDGAVPGELVHAATAAETRTVKAAHLRGAIKRTFMKPPYMPGGRAI
jgi:hypothetical protein